MNSSSKPTHTATRTRYSHNQWRRKTEAGEAIALRL